MTFKEYGTVVEPAKKPGEFKEFGQSIEPLSRIQSLAHAPAKGAVKRAGDIAGFVQSIAPFLPKGGLTQEKAHKFAEEKFPTFEKGPEKFLERAGGVATEALLSPGGLAAKAIQIPLGAGLGYAAEELGLPEWAQSIAEGFAFFYKGGKKVPLKADQKKLGEFLRNQGLTENEITPLLKTPEQINRWSGMASKGKKSRELMESIYHKSGKIYDSITVDAKNLPPLNNQAKTKILNDFTGIWNNLPDKFRKLIEKDVQDFLTKGRAGVEDLINLDKDINAVIGAEHGGRAAVGLFKEPIMDAIRSVNPKIAEDYSLAKELYGTRAKVKGSLVNPKDFDKFLDAGEAYALGMGIFNRDIGMIQKVLGVAGGRVLAREMLINPRLQNISIRIGEALKKNKYLLAEKYLRSFNDALREDEPELANEIDHLFLK